MEPLWQLSFACSHPQPPLLQPHFSDTRFKCVSNQCVACRGVSQPRSLSSRLACKTYDRLVCCRVGSHALFTSTYKENELRRLWSGEHVPITHQGKYWVVNAFLEQQVCQAVTENKTNLIKTCKKGVFWVVRAACLTGPFIGQALE